MSDSTPPPSAPGAPPTTTTPAAPPTTPDATAVARRTIVWPTVIGVIAIVFAAGGLLAGVMGLVTWVVFQATGSMPDFTFQQYTPETLAMMIVYFPLALLLLAGGILMVVRRRAAVPCLIVWAVLRIAHGLLSVVFQYQAQLKMIDAMGGAPSNPVEKGMMTLSMAFGFLWAAALPVFLLIWLTRGKVRADVDEYFTGARRGPTA